MQLIVGLGNPGEAYAGTRHNLGYMLLEEICRRNDCRKWRRESRCVIAPCRIEGHDLLLARPGTWMNTSGPAIRTLMNDREIDASTMVVAHDDVDLELGQLRIRTGGGTGGHRGIRSLVDALETPDFVRMRMGLGRPPETREMTDWVLEPFRRSEMRHVEDLVARAAEAAESVVRDGVREAMNRYNRWPMEE